jgi:DNA-binding CsgD family transcriptional regulator/tetratricopeptide (TPR) repeat protein
VDRSILEREHELAVLAVAAREAAGGAGCVALVYGEAGIGKSSLVDAVGARLPAEGRMLVGYCDDLATKRTLGPFRDLVGNVGPELTRTLHDGGDPGRLLAALRSELDRPGQPTVLAIEDVHWADEATLDLLRLLVRRVGGLPVVLLLTYRDDELTPEHPARDLLGLAAATHRVHRLSLQRLSPQAVHALSVGTRVDSHHLYDVTRGNPFFVGEILAFDDDAAVPATVIDAVRTRVRRLDGGSREALEQLAVVPSTLDRWLVDVLIPQGLGALTAAEERGLLVVSPSRVGFRHEITRRAIVDSLPTARKVELSRNVLAALVGRAGADLSQIMHHAAQAGDPQAIARFGPDVARDASLAGAHREAAEHYRLVLEHRDRFSPRERAELLEGYAVECYTIGVAQDAVIAQREAVELRRTVGDVQAFGAALRWLSRMHWWAGDRPAAELAAAEASKVLEYAGDTRLLALALSNESQLHMLANRSEEGVRLGERAAVLARDVGDAAILSHALTNIALCRWTRGDRDGQATVEEALRIALDAGETDHALRAYQAIVSTLLDMYRLDEARRYLAEALALAGRADHHGFVEYLSLEQARLQFAAAAWGEALRTVDFAIDKRPPLRCPALTIVGRIRVRRGTADAEQPLMEAWDLAVGMDELQRTGPVAVGLAEAAWLRGDHAAARAVAGPVFADACRLGEVAWAAEVGYWLSKTGHEVPDSGSDHPYAVQATGRWRDAAEAWQAAGCPYEHAAALAESPDPEDLLTALAELDLLGAAPLARLVRRRLRALGVARIPRGPVNQTRANPGGLTGRQVEVVRLLGEGLTNVEIAERLVVSPRTVEVHVAAVLEKLEAPSRRRAVERAAELGLLNEAPDRDST